MIAINTNTHSSHGEVIKCHFKPGSVERSIDLYQRGVYLSSCSCRQYVQRPPPIKIEKFHSGILLYPFLTVLKTFKKYNL
jgi:hypothetical protein